MEINVNAYARAYIPRPTNFSMTESYQKCTDKGNEQTLHQAKQT